VQYEKGARTCITNQTIKVEHKKTTFVSQEFILFFINQYHGFHFVLYFFVFLIFFLLVLCSFMISLLSRGPIQTIKAKYTITTFVSQEFILFLLTTILVSSLVFSFFVAFLLFFIFVLCSFIFSVLSA